MTTMVCGVCGSAVPYVSTYRPEHDLPDRPRPPELVTLKEISGVLGVTRYAVGQWRTGTTNAGPLPEPELVLSKRPVWRLTTVLDWARQVGVGKTPPADRYDPDDRDVPIPALMGPDEVISTVQSPDDVERWKRLRQLFYIDRLRHHVPPEILSFASTPVWRDEVITPWVVDRARDYWQPRTR